MDTTSMFRNGRRPKTVLEDFVRATLALLAVVGVLGAAEVQAQSEAPPETAGYAPRGVRPGPPYMMREVMKLTGSYSMGFATGKLHDFVGEPSFRGFDLTAVWPVHRSLYIGASLASNAFYEEKARDTYERGPTAITAKLYRYADFWNTSLVTRYYFLKPSSFARPYAGLRIGVAFLRTTTLAADLSDYDSPVGFALAPELGAQIRIAGPVAGSIAYTYNYSTASTGKFDNLSFGALHFGLTMQWPSE